MCKHSSVALGFIFPRPPIVVLPAEAQEEGEREIWKEWRGMDVSEWMQHSVLWLIDSVLVKGWTRPWRSFLVLHDSTKIFFHQETKSLIRLFIFFPCSQLSIEREKSVGLGEEYLGWGWLLSVCVGLDTARV